MREIELKTMLRNCGKCTLCFQPSGICPIYEEFGIPSVSPAGIFYLTDGIFDGYIKMSSEVSNVPFSCTMCGACATKCLSGFIDIYETPTKLMEGIRELFIDQGQAPEEIAKTLKNLSVTKNAWRFPKSQRIEWEKKCEITVPDYRQEKKEYLLFVGDAALISETEHIPDIITKILHRGGVDFGTLKEDEVDSGNEAREMGEIGLFNELALQNIENFQKYSVKKIIVISPHDYHTFTHDYSRLGMEIEGIYHYTEIINELIKEEKIRVIKKIPKTVTYQDPCHLGRYNKIYQAPREILKAIPGIKLAEMRCNFDEGFCCGAGGGRMWYDPEDIRIQRISDIRVRHAQEAKADIIATACPYCLSNLKAAGNLDDVTVKDVVELVLDSTE